MTKPRSLLLLVFASGLALSCASRGAAPPATQPDPYTFVAAKHLLSGYPGRNADGTINVVVEIPAGTNAKWEVSKDDGTLRWEFKDGEPRVVRYLSYPANYGMVPRSLLPRDLGGDGDPLDVVLLGPAIPRGEVVRARLVGVLELLDGGERDDKLLAVLEGSPLASAHSLRELDEQFPGVTTIVETWFTSYKGPGQMESRGFGDVAQAERILDAALRAYDRR